MRPDYYVTIYGGICAGDNDEQFCKDMSCVDYRPTSTAPTEQEGNGGSTPSQYSFPEGMKELQDLIEYRDMNFAVGNIFKACYRLGKKNDPEYDINKIIWFAQRELNRLKNKIK